MQRSKLVIASIVAVALYGLGSPYTAEADSQNEIAQCVAKPNIIVILADDVGKDASNLYNAQTEEENFPETAPTPSLQALADQGILFTNGWAMPSCTVTRGTRTMGLLPSSSGVGDILGDGARTAHSSDDSILYPPYVVDPFDPDLIQKRVRNAGYRTYKIGKWHETEGSVAERVQDTFDAGFDKFYGQAGGGPDFFAGYGGNNLWVPANNLGEGPTYEFMTSALVTRAIRFIEEGSDKPYYLALDFAAAHFLYEVAPGPDELPPPDYPDVDWRTLDPVIHADVIEQVKAAFAGDFAGAYPPAGTSAYKYRPPFDTPEVQEAKRRAAFKSLISYLDVQLGRLMEHVDLRNTYVIFVGDNGTMGNYRGVTSLNVVEAPEDPDRSKTTLYHNGVEVPFLIAGPRIREEGRTSDALVTTTDIYATVLDLVGDKQPKQTRFDSISFTDVLKHRCDLGHKREFNVAEQFLQTPAAGGTVVTTGGVHGRAVSDGRYRLIAQAVVETKSVVVDVDGEEKTVVYQTLACTPDDPAVPSYGPDCTSDNPVAIQIETDPDTGESSAAAVFNPDYNYFQTEVNGTLKVTLEFYDTASDPIEGDNLLASPKDMNPLQKAAFLQHCNYMDRVSKNASFYFTDKKVCRPIESLIQGE